MMISADIRIKNLPQLQSAFSRAPHIMNQEFRQALRQSGLVLATKSVELAPHRTGDLQRSHWLHGSGGVDIKGQGLKMTASVAPTVDYAVFVHEGTRFMKARPFLREASRLVENQIQVFFTEAAQRGLNRIARMT